MTTQAYATTTAWRAVRTLVWRHRALLGAGFTLMTVNRLAVLALPAASKFLVDDVVGRGRAELLPLIGAAALTGIGIETATGFLLAQITTIGSQRVITELRSTLQAHLVQLPIGFFESNSTGTLIARVMNDAEGVRTLVGTGLVQLAGGVITAAVALGVLVTLDWRLAAAVGIILAVYVVALRSAFARMYAAFNAVNEQTAALTTRLTEALGGIRIVKTYVAERTEADVFARTARVLQRRFAQAMTSASVLAAGSGLVTGLTGLVVLVLGSRGVLAHTISLGDMTMSVFLVGLLTAPLLEAAGYGSELGKAAAGLVRIGEIQALTTESDQDSALGAQPVARVIGAVAFENVSYEYRTGHFVLRDVEFVAPAGSTTGLVGPSGAGKSTICRLLLAWDRPTLGRVVVDGRDLSQLRRTDYRRNVSVVPQEGFLFDGTVAENIRYGRPHATAAEVRRAGRIAHCAEFVAALPSGYDTVIGERGVRLSGGERQRVAIARAILADPAILVLDEATSNLDSESEALIQDALCALMANRTTFVIAHRLSTVLRADQVLVLKAGSVVERGTHSQLLAREGLYWSLYQTQFSGVDDRTTAVSQRPLVRRHRGLSDIQPLRQSAGDPLPD